VDRRRVRIVPEWSPGPGGGVRRHVSTFLELFSIVAEKWVRIENPEWFVRHIYNDEEARLGHGRGLLEAIYFYSYAKQIVLREGLQGLERWAQGLAIVKIDGFRKGSKNKPNTAVATAWLDAIEKTKARHGLVGDKQDDISVEFPRGTGHQMVTEFLRYLDDAMTRLITGALLPSGGGENKGSLGRASVEEGKQEALVQYDRELLDEVLTRDLLGMIFRQNRANWVALGLGEAECPKFATVQEKREDAKEAADIATILIAGGVPLRKDEVYKKTNYTQPAEGDEVFVAPVAEAFPGFDLDQELATPPREEGTDDEPTKDAEVAKDEAATVNELSLAIERLEKIGDTELINSIRKEIARRLGVPPPNDLAIEKPEEEPAPFDPGGGGASLAADWDESKHPRAEDGRWGDKPGERESKDPESKPEKPKDPWREANKKWQEGRKAWKKSLSKEEKTAVQHFTGSGYDEIKVYLSGDMEEFEDLEYDEAKAKAAVEGIDSALARGAVYPGVVSRGLSLVPDEVVESWTPGATLEFASYQSTSRSDEVVRGFLGREGDDAEGKVMFTFQGGEHNAVTIEDISTIKDERESLIPRGSRYEVVSAEDEYGGSGEDKVKLWRRVQLRLVA
jgi:hypothetical protein